MDYELSALADILFQSTPSTRRVTCSLACYTPDGWISIHTLHTEGDHQERGFLVRKINFNPHPPHGG